MNSLHASAVRCIHKKKYMIEKLLYIALLYRLIDIGEDENSKNWVAKLNGFIDLEFISYACITFIYTHISLLLNKCLKYVKGN